MPLASILLASLIWYPSAGWTEKPDPSASPYARRGGVMRLNGAQPPKSFNAYTDNNAYTSMLFDMMYDRLLGVDSQTGELVPALAKRWAVSSDGNEFVFEIDPRAKWSDGKSVTAYDVKWTFDTVLDPASDTGPWKPTLAFFESPIVVDDLTVRFKKKGSSGSDWRDILNCSTFWILPRHAFEGKDFNKLEFANAVSGGPYFISRVAEQIETELTRHGRWWRQDLPSCRGTCNFDKVVVRYFADNENAFEAFKKRKIDLYPVYTARIYAEGTRSEIFGRNLTLKRRVKNHAPIGFQGFAMNMRRAPFNKLEVRQAMAKLVDRETMNRTMMNGAYFLLSSYWQDLYDSKHPCTNTVWKYDVKGAKELLRKAGYANGFSFTFLSRSSTEDKFLSLFSHALAECGVQMEIVRKDFAAWMRDMDDFNFDMTWAAWGAGRVKYPELSWSSREAARKGSNNITGFSDPVVDKLIDDEKKMSSMDERTEAYRQMDARIAATVPYVLLWQTDSTRLLYWNKFGTPPAVLSRLGREEAALSYWWYDMDKAEELFSAIGTGGCLPNVPEIVDFDNANEGR
jgi:microcin C transport system substrate-binding protein